ncbi:MAG: DUF4337 domain-containing protein [Verrucomicrobiota bacterium]
MDIDPLESVNELTEKTTISSLNRRIAITVALISTFLALCKVKDDNIVQAMQKAQADQIDQWNFYQARNLREEIAALGVDQLRLSAKTAPAVQKQEYDQTISKYEQLTETQKQKKLDAKSHAEEAQKNYDLYNYRDDQFDLCESLLALSISLMAITALTSQNWLYWLTMIPTSFGVLMGIAGLFGLKIHSDWIARILS